MKRIIFVLKAALLIVIVLVACEKDDTEVDVVATSKPTNVVNDTNASDSTNNSGGGISNGEDSINNNVQDSIIAMGTVTDIDGNVYNTLKIGNLIWSVENLRTTHFKNGDSIEKITSSTPWQQNLSSSWDGAYCFFGNSNTVRFQEKWGALYNWNAVTSSKGLAPEGWRIATDDDWTALEEYLISHGYNWNASNTGNKIAKALAAKTEWADDGGYDLGAVGTNLDDNNASGFTALPSYGRTNTGSYGTDHNVNNYCTWWTSTGGAPSNTAWVRTLMESQDYLLRDSRHRGYGLPVRIVKDAN